MSKDSHRFVRNVAAIGLLLVIFVTPVWSQLQEPTPQDTTPLRFGLFIGIDEYPHLSPEAQLKGCVRDARTLQGLFESQFGFDESTLLINDLATREGIRTAIVALVESVKNTREKTERPVSVVLTYAGHGSQVRDQRGEGADEQDRLDETWVCYDSSGGDKDIRDDEIAVAFRQLADLGAQILFISDSCHSGSMYRGESTHAVREVIRDEPGPGPLEHLFPEWRTEMTGQARGNVRGGMVGLIDAPPSEGFIAYTACRDYQQARECLDENHQPCGRLSYVLRRVLPAMGPYSTYSEVFEQIAIEFDSLWRDYSQVPQFAASAAKTNERFLEGGFPPLHATIVPNSKDANTVELTMGSIQGVSKGASFDFFRTISDLTEHKDRLTSGTVISVQPFRCRVEVESLVAVPETAKARLDRVRMDDFFVYVDETAGEELNEAVHELARGQQLQRVEILDDASIAVVRDPVSGDIGIYSPSAMPYPDLPESRRPDLLERFTGRTPEIKAEQLRQSLLYRARIHRILTLEYNENQITSEVVKKERDKNGVLVDADSQPSPNGFQQLFVGDQFAIRITNNTNAPLYFTVLYCGVDGSVDHVYPAESDPVEVLKPGDSIELGSDNPFTATIESTEEEELKRQGFVRTRLKVIASSDNIDFFPIVTARAQAGTRGADLDIGLARGDQPELQKFLADILHGGPLTRGSPTRAGLPATWATGIVIYDVRPK